MKRFHSTFKTVGNNSDFSARAWEQSFCEKNKSLWQKEQGGTIQFIEDNGLRKSLIFSYKKEMGLAISLDHYNKNDLSQNRSMVCVGLPEKMNCFELLENGMVVSMGSFVSFQKAWEITGSFLSVPLLLPKCVEWVDSNQLDWPDKY